MVQSSRTASQKACFKVTERRYVGRDPASFGFQTIRYAKGGGRATITLHRPEVLNAVNGPMLAELSDALKDASWDDSVGVLVLTGAGDRAFCTGADLQEQEQFLARPRDYWKWMGEFIEVHERLRNLGKPSVARLNGMVVGGGNEFNLSCDLAVAADDIYIRHVGTSRGSVALAGATQFFFASLARQANRLPICWKKFTSPPRRSAGHSFSI